VAHPNKNPATNLTYTIEVSGDLEENFWSSLDTVIEENEPTHLLVRDKLAVSEAPKRFIRLRVLVNP